MDHSLEDPMTLESAMTVDFESPSDVANTESDINLESNNPETNISMEYELDEQPILMDTENEEIIDQVDFMGDQITLQEYPNQEEQSVTVSTSQANTSIFTSQPEQKIETPTISQMSVQEIKAQPKYITVKAALPRVTTKKIETATLPRQVAIAPKPAKLVHGTIIPKGGLGSGQCAIAPKPITLVTNRPASSFIKKPIVGQANLKQNTVFAKIGNQIVMVPSEGGQKYKLVSAASGGMPVQYIKSEAKQPQMILPKTMSGLSGIQNKPVLAKLVIAGNAGATTGRIVTMQPKTVPITVNNKVLVTSPTKQALKIAPKQHVVTLKSPTKLVTTSQGTTSKKVVITTNPTNMVMKTIAPKTTQVIKEVNTANVQSPQKTQLYQINVPGKGIQYIRLVSSQNSKSADVKPHTPVLVPSKAKVLTDSKGNVLQVPANKTVTSQAPPLMITGQTTSVNTVPTKSVKTYFRIAPVTKTQQTITNKSLLAPITTEKLPERQSEKGEGEMETESRNSEGSDLVGDSKEVLREMLTDTELQEHEVEIEFERPQQREPSASPPRSECEENPLIVIGGAFREQQPDEASGDDTLNVYQNNSHMDADALGSEYGLRPRKACNCTKSQCLKLYCDCFANGEFCNRCNCNNCFNNLENEEYRQKAIRGCLERNPNAFKPKIGKTKDGGPEIVRRHNKGCNCKKSGCLKNYCECYEAKIACTAMCKCVGCRNVEETLERTRRRQAAHDARPDLYRPPSHAHLKHPCNFLTSDVIEAVCQCLIAVAVDSEAGERAEGDSSSAEPVRNVIEEFSRCLQDIISAAHHSPPLVLLKEERA